MMPDVSVRFAEDYRVGEIVELGTYTITRDEMIEFARKYDPHGFHIDEEVAKSSIFGGLIASGWLTALVWFRLMHGRFIFAATSLGSPGLEEMKWPKPVRPGDRLRGCAEVKDVRISRSRPDRGFVRYTATLTNQFEEPVLTATSTLMVRTRHQAT